MMIGKTISLAGIPKIKANKITPSSPIRLAMGSRKVAVWVRILIPDISIFAINQMIKPAGIATIMARFRTVRVLSKIERTIICFS